MSTGTEDFDQLRKLLKLKNHEQPPPGYFDHLAGRVMHRLENRKGTGGFGARFSWVVKLQRVLAANPISAGILAVCGVFMVVVANYNYQYAGSGAPLNLSSSGGDTVADKGVGTGGFIKMASSTPDDQAGSQAITVSPMIPAATIPAAANSPFNSFPSLQAQTVSFTVGP